MALDYPFLNLSDMLTSSASSFSTTTSTTDATSISSSGIVTSSLFMTEGGLDTATCGADGGMPAALPPHLNGWSCSNYSTAEMQHHNSVYTSPPPHLHLSTPDSSPLMSYPPQYPAPAPPVSSTHLHPPLPPLSDLFFIGSSLDESPISSPGDLEKEGVITTATSGGVEQQNVVFRNRSCSPRSQLGISLTSFDSSSSGEDDSFPHHNPVSHRSSKPVPDGIKMPQRKGGMQLWQFLYSMLNDKDRKYQNLIEWTHTAKERQFRLLEPDAIAVWWGHHKNKPNMSYDKLSRSLRYYYDKGIIRKISGERFVYRFCIDPEIMYKHMGTSNARPQLKPMPQDAKVALSTKEHSVMGGSPCIAVEPETLPNSVAASRVEHIPTSYPPPPLFQTHPSFTNSLSIPSTSSFTMPLPHPPAPPAVAPEMRRCHSYDSTYRSGPVISSPVQTPSPSSYDGYYGDYNSVPLNFTSTNSSPNTSPPQSATDYSSPHVTNNNLHPQAALPLLLPFNDNFTTFSFPPQSEAMSVPPFTSTYH